ncbi:hypothetical protein J7L27_01690 [Candidatus Bathyarchaeota archaeon]|nr:hypothetical protein [Candidatus Bathyarchaeota archaeon]
MRWFGRKKKKSEETVYEYEIFGGFTITKTTGGYEIRWKNPNVTTINVHSMPVISEDVETKVEGDVTHVLTKECKLKLVTKEGKTEAYISKI